MNRDAHYYALLAFCRACGFKKRYAHEVAYSSQFVDDARINHIAIKGNIPRNVECEDIEGQPSLFNMATCHSYMRLKTFNYDSMVNNTTAFHFVPGCEGATFTKKLRCKEDSPIIMNILREALEGEDLVRLGIAFHAYADTFSHQGFSGILSRVNDIRNLRSSSRAVMSGSDSILKIGLWFDGDGIDNRFDSVMPAYGHCQALEYPDIPHANWSYKYDMSDRYSGTYRSSGRINNRLRYSRAFDRIQDYLEEYLRRHPRFADDAFTYNKLYILSDALFMEKPLKERERSWRRLLVREGLFDALDPELKYDEGLWLRRAFSNFQKSRFNKRVVNVAELASGFGKSEWYRFYLAAKWYKERFFDYCSQYGLDIPR